jgi:hypothetical protein
LCKISCDCRWWDYIALPQDVDASGEDSFRKEIRDLAFTVTMLAYYLRKYTMGM